MPTDILAIAAHRDDVELTCAGTLLRAADAGYRTAILDLTAGESGTHGSAAVRGREADEAAKILQRGRASQRRPAGRASHEQRRDAPGRDRAHPPLRPARGHPPLRSRSAPGSSRRLRAGSGRLLPGGPRPLRGAAARRTGRTRFCTRWRTGKTRSSLPSWWTSPPNSSASSPPSSATRASSTARRPPARSSLPARTCTRWCETQNAHYGSLIRRRYGEPFFTHETLLVDDVVKLEVQSM